MAIKTGDLIGYWNPGNGTSYPTKARTFGLDPQMYPVSEWNGGFVVRSRNFVLSTNPSFTQSAGITDADCTTAFEASTAGDTPGWLPPAGFELPDGYYYVTDPKGQKYIKEGEDTNSNGIPDSEENGGGDNRSANFLDQAWTWIKANPLIVAGVVIVVIYLYSQSGGKSKKKKFLGLL